MNIYNQPENAKKKYKMLSTSNFFEFALFSRGNEISFLIESLNSLLCLVLSVRMGKLEALENEYYGY